MLSKWLNNSTVSANKSGVIKGSCDPNHEMNTFYLFLKQCTKYIELQDEYVEKYIIPNHLPLGQGENFSTLS